MCISTSRVFLLSVCVSFITLNAQTWQRIGPSYKPTKGLTYDVLPDPQNPKSIIVGTRPQGLLKSDDSGKTWIRTSKAFPKNGNIGPNQESMSRSLSHPNIIYAGIELTGILKSVDNGASWKSAAKTLPKGRARNGVSTVVHPTNPNIVWLGTDGGLFKTVDGGKNWRRITKGLPSGKTKINDDVHQTIAKIIIDEKQTQNMWLGMYATGENEAAGIWRSQDGGESWSHVSNGIDSGVEKSESYGINRDWIMSFERCGASDVFIASTPLAIYISRDATLSWKKLNFEGGASAVAIHPQNHNHLFASINDGFVKESKDGGKTWKDISHGLRTGKIENAPVFNVRFTDAEGKTKIHKGTDHRYTNKVMSFHFIDDKTLLACCHAGLYKLILE